ncbi:mechanosensitive ion channel family protein [Paracoccus suum]|uniref:Mechanosensitive ion channel family protein n=2 Tax=Paracoccus suum TaxID=2259340 RepID=A0A344PPD8_9RHOB|nr:mechanosensitive ion channel family protein [Paracoccus suum]
MLLCAPLSAQTDTAEPDYATWDKFATQVEQSLDRNDVDDAALQQMRSRVVDWRARFLAAQGSKSTRVGTLQDQIAALGPAPAADATEPEDVAARRKELNAELSAEQAPVLRASEAYGRAEGMVTAIDKTLRSRQAAAVLQLTPSPLLPSSWAAAASDGNRLAAGLRDEVGARLQRFGATGAAQKLPGVAVPLAIALLLLTVGRRWVNGLPGRLARRLPTRAQGAVSFIASLTQIGLPVVGVFLVLVAIEATGLLGQWGTPFVLSAAAAGVTFFIGAWIARQLFPVDPAQASLLGLVSPARDAARHQATLLAAAMALEQFIARPLLPLSGFNRESDFAASVPVPFSDAGAGVVHLPLILLGALPLFRLGKLLRPAPATVITTSDKVLATLAAIVRVIAVVAPLAAVTGYVTAANATLWPAAVTLALAGLIVLLQQFFVDLWQIVRRTPEGARDSLAPVIIGLALLLVALPILALTWGARVSDLAEVWTRLANGFRIGSVRLSPGAVITFFVVFALGYTVTRGVQSTLRKTVLPRTRIDAGGQNAIVSGLGYVGIFIAAMLAIVSAGIDLSSLAIVAGALSVGIGFGLQNIVSNFVSGIILLIERPVTVGDWVQVGTAQGVVRRISVRSTTIQTFDRSSVVVPNSDLITQHVTNWTRGSLSGRVIVAISVAYSSDTRKVTDMLIEIAENQPTVLIEPAPLAILTGFGPDGINFELRAIVSDINQGTTVASEMRQQIVERMKAEGIEMPFAQRDIWLRNPESLAPSGPNPLGSAGAGAPVPDTKTALPRAAQVDTRRPTSGASADAGKQDELDPRIAASVAGGPADGGSEGGR